MTIIVSRDGDDYINDDNGYISVTEETSLNFADNNNNE